jgi:hypothetical protein
MPACRGSSLRIAAVCGRTSRPGQEFERAAPPGEGGRRRTGLRRPELHGPICKCEPDRTFLSKACEISFVMTNDCCDHGGIK